MNDPSITPDERYENLVKTLLSYDGVTQLNKKGLGSGLRIHKKVFAMLSRGHLVVKLPQQRVEALTDSGEGERYDHGDGRLMKEWFTVQSMSEEKWLLLAKEAMEFAASKN